MIAVRKRKTASDRGHPDRERDHPEVAAVLKKEDRKWPRSCTTAPQMTAVMYFCTANDRGQWDDHPVLQKVYKVGILKQIITN